MRAGFHLPKRKSAQIRRRPHAHSPFFFDANRANRSGCFAHLGSRRLGALSNKIAVADIFKALALGATATLIGRAYIHGLTVGGATGVARLAEILLQELRAAMALCGIAMLRSIDSSVWWDGSSSLSNRA